MRLAFAVIIAFAPAVAGIGSGPALQVTDPSPFTVVGMRFVPLERVTVVAQVEGRHVQMATANAAGVFTVRFAGVTLGHCQAYIVRATGDRGSQAYLRSLSECMPPEPAP